MRTAASWWVWGGVRRRGGCGHSVARMVVWGAGAFEHPFEQCCCWSECAAEIGTSFITLLIGVPALLVLPQTLVLVHLVQYLTLACGCCPAAQSFAEKPKTKEALDAMRVDTTCLGECGVTRAWRKGRAGGQGR